MQSGSALSPRQTRERLTARSCHTTSLFFARELRRCRDPLAGYRRASLSENSHDAQMTLDDYIDAEGKRRWFWGKCDCVQFALGWARANTGRPLPAFFEYGSRGDAVRALQARGGLAAIVREWMALNDFALTAEPDDGDIGLARVPVPTAESVAPVALVIRRGPWWLTREPRGIGGAGTMLEVISAWRIC